MNRVSVSVSNPWREAIEALGWLLFKSFKKVSNPWREAIEGNSSWRRRKMQKVSNPWREAIEEIASGIGLVAIMEFPILGGRLLKFQNWLGFVYCYMFPILGGRLLKKTLHNL